MEEDNNRIQLHSVSLRVDYLAGLQTKVYLDNLKINQIHRQVLQVKELLEPYLGSSNNLRLSLEVVNQVFSNKIPFLEEEQAKLPLLDSHKATLNSEEVNKLVYLDSLSSRQPILSEQVQIKALISLEEEEEMLQICHHLVSSHSSNHRINLEPFLEEDSRHRVASLINHSDKEDQTLDNLRLNNNLRQTYLGSKLNPQILILGLWANNRNNSLNKCSRKLSLSSSKTFLEVTQVGSCNHNRLEDFSVQTSQPPARYSAEELNSNNSDSSPWQLVASNNSNQLGVFLGRLSRLKLLLASKFLNHSAVVLSLNNNRNNGKASLSNNQEEDKAFLVLKRQ